eukprot:2990799-Rhodomonas_salina.1
MRWYGAVVLTCAYRGAREERDKALLEKANLQQRDAQVRCCCLWMQCCHLWRHWCQMWMQCCSLWRCAMYGGSGEVSGGSGAVYL